MGDEVGLPAFGLDGGDNAHQLIDSSILSMQMLSTQQTVGRRQGLLLVLAVAALVNT
jgi:hypothetical protein